MNFRNYTQISFGHFNNIRKKTNKLQNQSLIPNLQQEKELLFENPESYLKLPYETNFKFVVGRKPKGPRFNSDNKLIPYSIVGFLLKKDPSRKLTRKKSLVQSITSSKSVRKSQRLTKLIKISPNVIINEVTPKEEKRKKISYIDNITHTEIFDIFNKSKKRISKNKSVNLKNKKFISKEIPKLMHQFINEPLEQQERALKNNEKYNKILKRIEKNITKSLINKFKSNKNNIKKKLKKQI